MVAGADTATSSCPRVIGAEGARLVLCGAPLPCAQHGAPRLVTAPHQSRPSGGSP
jgi:hypothetical protein